MKALTRFFVSEHLILYHYIIISLYHYIIISLYHYIIIYTISYDFTLHYIDIYHTINIIIWIIIVILIKPRALRIIMSESHPQVESGYWRLYS